MNFQQLRLVREAIRCGYNLTEVARVLHTSQPGVSRQIRELEEELGVELFVREGKRLTRLTPVGAVVAPMIERILADADNVRRAGDEFSQQASGRLSIATTHSQARYALPGAVRDFRQRYPDVSLHLHQGTPDQVAGMLMSGEADIGIATEARHLFRLNVTRLGVRRGTFLRSYVYDFIKTFAPSLSRDVVERAKETAPGTPVEG